MPTHLGQVIVEIGLIDLAIGRLLKNNIKP